MLNNIQKPLFIMGIKEISDRCTFIPLIILKFYFKTNLSKPIFNVCVYNLRTRWNSVLGNMYVFNNNKTHTHTNTNQHTAKLHVRHHIATITLFVSGRKYYTKRYVQIVVYHTKRHIHVCFCFSGYKECKIYRVFF